MCRRPRVGCESLLSRWWDGLRHLMGKATVDEAEARRRLSDRPDVELLQYGGTAKGPSRFRCPEGHEWVTSAQNVFGGSRCWVCFGPGPVDQAEVRRRLADRADVELVQYAGTVSGQSMFRCPKGHEWETTASSVLAGTGCRACSKGGPPAVEEVEVLRRLSDLPDVDLVHYGGTVGVRSTFRCPEGHEWEATASKIFMGRRCPICASRVPIDEAETRRRLADRPDVELVHFAGTARGRSTFRCRRA